MTAPLLIVVTGPIASGKSSVAKALARLLEKRGRRAANVDLDEFRRDRRVAAALTDELFAAGNDTVIVDGPFFTPEERNGYLAYVKTEVDPLFVTLRVSFEESHRRALGDASRVSSRDRSWLSQRYAASTEQLQRIEATDLIVDTDGKTPGDIARAIVRLYPARFIESSQ